MRVERRMLVRMILAASLVITACGDDNEPVQEPVPLPEPTPVAYPEGLWDRGVQGETIVLIHVNEMGDVDSALVSKTSGFSDFDSAAVNGAFRLRFTPAQQGDRRIAMWTRIPIRFARDSAVWGPTMGWQPSHD